MPLEIKKCKLFVEPDPKDSVVRVLNISEKFHQGMALKPGRYHLEISHNSYETKKKWVELKAGESRKTIKIHLEVSPVDYGRYLVYPSGVIWDSNTELEWLIGPDKGIKFPEAEKMADDRKYRHPGRPRVENTDSQRSEHPL